MQAFQILAYIFFKKALRSLAWNLLRGAKCQHGIERRSGEPSAKRWNLQNWSGVSCSVLVGQPVLGLWPRAAQRWWMHEERLLSSPEVMPTSGWAPRQPPAGGAVAFWGNTASSGCRGPCGEAGLEHAATLPLRHGPARPLDGALPTRKAGGSAAPRWPLAAAPRRYTLLLPAATAAIAVRAHVTARRPMRARQGGPDSRPCGRH